MLAFMFDNVAFGVVGDDMVAMRTGEEAAVGKQWVAEERVEAPHGAK